LVVSASLNLENVNVFEIKIKNQSPENVYVDKIKLNGKTLYRNYILHSEIIKGGSLIFFMSDK